MFEKSLYDLIRGLRNHKGNEREYIQESLRECRKEIKGSDMDLKATALLKLTYLEMFGHDMSWASFNVLEVMSSPKYAHKKVGYLAAVQSFRSDTEVVMLAENLLKKDLSSPQPTTITLPLSAVPHIINPSMANSLLSELLPRLTHSHASIRKKTAVTLYRLALVYPETLRPAWPRIKERLLADDEDPTVTAAVVNVVCELGSRRPQDFLPLAPRLFDLLVQGGNNWMAIKIIKLFANLTPLEPRLIKKLHAPLATIIKTTPAMSLLYECINGIIQGGIFEGVEGTTQGEEIARLCVRKLRGMLVVEGDPNLKYVALLAFEKIVRSHPHLVSLHQDVILECIDDFDLSIKSQALGLVAGMVNSDNITTIVGRLTRQLRNAPAASAVDELSNGREFHEGVVPIADPSDDEAEQSIRRNEKRPDQSPPLPEDYRIRVIRSILEMCSRDTYANITDFGWYIDVLVQLVRVSPVSNWTALEEDSPEPHAAPTGDKGDVSSEIGKELQNVAVRVKAVRSEATEAAQSLVLIEGRERMFPSSGGGGQGVLGAAAWIVGEYCQMLTKPEGVLHSLMHPSSGLLPHNVLAVYLQAIPKVFVSISSDGRVSWTPERKSMVMLLMARIVHFLEPLAVHPNLEVQERAVGYVELMRVASEAASGLEAGSRDGDFVEPPLLLTHVIPSLFTGLELNPVAPGAQRKVPVPDGLDLDAPINPHLPELLQKAECDVLTEPDEDDAYRFYHQKPAVPARSKAAADRLETREEEPRSYQVSAAEDEQMDSDTVVRRKAERRAHNRDDPFYIATGDERSGTLTPLHSLLRTNSGDDLDLDSIPVMELDLETRDRLGGDHRSRSDPIVMQQRKRVREKFEILVDENLGPDEPTPRADSSRLGPSRPVPKGKRPLLEVDSTGLATLSLDEAGNSRLDLERRAAEEAEMAKALKEVERLRLEMQRANERIQAKDVPPEGQLVQRKKKRPKEEVRRKAPAVETGDVEVAVVKKKKKKKKTSSGDNHTETAGVTRDDDKAKKRKKRSEAMPMDGPATTS